MGRYSEQCNLTKKRDTMFFNEYEKTMDELINNLIEFRLDSNIKHRNQIKNIFNMMKEKSSTLGYNELSKLGEYYEKYIESLEYVDDNSHGVFSELLKGLGIIKKHIDELKTEHREKVFINNMEQDNSNLHVKRGNILLLDDDRLISTILKDAFEAEGYNIMTTADPYEAIEHILYKDINLALIDIIMPKLNGFEVLEILKQKGVDIPIIFLSGKSMTDYKVRALSRGVDDYITKPFEIKEVIARTERSLGRSSVYKNKLTVDKLTGVYNKEHFNNKIVNILSTKEHIEKDFSISFIDLDDFKSINDNYGHVIGDYALRDFAAFIKENLEDTEMIFRFGGDEFIVIFVDKTVSQAYINMESLRKKLDKTSFKYEDVPGDIKLSMSSGITYIGEDESMEEILDRADKCLYKSKKLGKNKTMKSNKL